MLHSVIVLFCCAIAWFFATRTIIDAPTHWSGWVIGVFALIYAVYGLVIVGPLWSIGGAILGLIGGAVAGLNGPAYKKPQGRRAATDDVQA